MQGKRTVLGVVGVRDYKGTLYTNTTHVVRTIEYHLQREGIDLASLQVVTGGGKGVEAMVVDWCEGKKVPCSKVPPNIESYGHTKAFTIRNNVIVNECDQLIVFWDGIITIPRECIATAMQTKKKATVYPVI